MSGVPGKQSGTRSVVPPITGELADAIAKAKAAGRWPPRVLHIGNIANNGYLNARILNEAGIPTDVLVYDYYHAMGCPEWEEGDIRGLPAKFDENRVDWTRVDVQDFTRPRWFSQGPFRWAMRYLESRRSGKELDATIHWHLLTFYRWLHAHPKLEVEFQKLIRLYHKLVLMRGTASYRITLYRARARAYAPSVLVNGLKSFILRTLSRVRGVLSRLRAIAHSSPVLAGRANPKLECSVTGAQPDLAVSAAPLLISASVPTSGASSTKSPPEPTGVTGDSPQVSAFVNPEPAIPEGSVPDAQPPEAPLDTPPSAHSADAQVTVAAPPAPVPARTPAPPAEDPLITQFRTWYPDRPDQLTATDLIPYRGSAPSFAKLFKHYDIVVGYATDPIWPMVADHPCYMAFEHGTLRGIPFENNGQGRMTAVAYRNAKCSFITNCDEIRAVEKLGLTNGRFIPHPMNDTLLAEADGGTIRKELVDKFDTNFIIFHPARQHWDDTRDPSLEKGNDLFIKAFGRFVREVNPKALLVAVRWGRSLEASDALLEKEGVTNRVHWMKPVPNRQMLRWLAACDLVADQFWLGCFGGITPKGYSMSKPVIIYLDHEIHDWCFPWMPPHVEERTPDAFFEFMAKLYQDPAHLKAVSEKSREWYVKYHSEASIRDRYVQALLDHWANAPAPTQARIA